MVSLILTTMNEERTVPGLLDDLLGQSRRPDELVIVDGGSRDGTVAILERYRPRLMDAGVPLAVIVCPGVNIARGRNQAIAAARGDLIAVTDAGCRLEPSWLERIVAPLEAGSADFVGGFFMPVARTPFQEAVARLTTASRPRQGFLHSSRSVAFTKALWVRAGGYPEWLRWGEDTRFDLSCLRAGARYVVAADAVVHWEVRRDARGVALQFFRYAYGDGAAGRLPRSHLVLQAVWWAGLLGAAFVSPWLLALPALYPVAWMVRRGATRLAEAPLTYAVAFLIQGSRFGGFSCGSVKRVLRGGSPL
jgi:glycosyltransferase involved in cell wall biosynthesis